MILCGFKMDHRRRGRQLHLGSKLSNATRHAHDLLQTRGQLKNPFKWLSQAKSTRMHPVQPLCAGILPKGYSRSGFPSSLEARHRKSKEGKAGKIGFGCFFNGLRERSYSCFARRHGSCRMGFENLATTGRTRFSSSGPDFNRFSRPARLPLTARILVIYG
jgi:hypothetical protein